MGCSPTRWMGVSCCRCSGVGFDRESHDDGIVRLA